MENVSVNLNLKPYFQYITTLEGGDTLVTKDVAGSRISFVLLSDGERDLDGLEGSDGADGVVVAVDLNQDVGLGGSNNVALEHANI